MIAIEDESDETENTFGLSVKRNFLMELYSNISDVIFFISFFLFFLKYTAELFACKKQVKCAYYCQQWHSQCPHKQHLVHNATEGGHGRVFCNYTTSVNTHPCSVMNRLIGATTRCGHVENEGILNLKWLYSGKWVHVSHYAAGWSLIQWASQASRRAVCNHSSLTRWPWTTRRHYKAAPGQPSLMRVAM